MSAAAHPHTVVLASAGTGKTYALTVRIIALLRSGADPGSILTTTFTRKAAGQILGRTFTLLAQAHADDASRAFLGTQLGSPISRDQCASLAALLARNLHRFGVLTIDALFARIAARFSLESGLGSRWSIATPEDLARLTADAVSDALSEPIADLKTGHDRRLSLALAIHHDLPGRSIHQDVVKLFADAAQAIEGRAGERAWGAIAPTSPPLTPEQLRQSLHAIASLPIPLTQAGTPRSAWAKAIRRISRQVTEGEWKRLLCGTLVERATDGTDFDHAPVPAEFREAISPLVAHAVAILISNLRARNLATFTLISRCESALNRRKDAEARYGFDDMPRRLLAADATGRLDDLYYRLDATIRYLLLDEFQDTSLTQFRIIEPIIDELVSTIDGSSEVFCVGDPKQSLYAWRGGLAELLPRLKQRWPQFEQTDLSVNRRSAPPIIQAVNDTFSTLESNPALADHSPAARDWSKRFKTHIAHKPDLAGVVRIWKPNLQPEDPPPDAHDSEEADDTDSDMSGAGDPIRFAAARVKALADQFPDFRIGILFRRNKLIHRLMRALRDHGLSASQEGGVPLLSCPPVAAAIALLHLADHPSDSAAQFIVATSPLGPAVGLTSPRDGRAAGRAAARLRRMLLTDGYGATLSRLRRRISDSLDAHSAERFDRLIDLAQQFDAEGAGLRPAAFALRARSRSVEDPTADRIRILTIHRAKGLEFDAVILPELGVPWTLRSGSLLMDRRNRKGDPDPFGEVTAVSWPADKHLRRYHAPLADLHARNEQLQVEEELCALYVAMTRARRILEMVLPTNARGAPSSATILASALAPGAIPDATGLLWSIGHEPLPEAPPPKPPDPPPIRITLAPPGPPPAHRWTSRSPSRLAGTVSIGGLFAPPSPALDHGTLLHAWFEQIEWLDDAPPTDQSLLACPAAVTLNDAASLLPVFRRSVADGTRLASLLRRAEYAARAADSLQVHRELPFSVPSPRPGTILTGRFDRVVVGIRDGRPAWAEIIDFKSDSVPDGNSRPVARHHEPQMRAYRDALAGLLSLNIQQITAVIAFIGPADIVRFRTRS